ncbi:hypothetical protein DENSPDRAFT_836276 [Dentipellis sp. KUC8613]|nr:hypothetical protein DENSPDRAFT_836276 [Dentipellis sp. KUC8613]
MHALSSSLVLFAAVSLAGAQTSSPASATSAHSSGSSAVSNASRASSASLPVSSVTVTGANGSSSVIPITVSPSSLSGSTTATSSAAFPTLSGYSTCVISCFDNSVANANCTSVTDVNCFCTNATFPRGLASCVSSNCPTDLSNAEALADQFCAVASTSTSLSFPPPTSSSAPSSASSTQPPSSSLPSASQTNSGAQGSPNSASGTQLGSWRAGGATVAVSAMGALIGALLL